MFSFTPSRDQGDAVLNLRKLLSPRIDPADFRHDLQRLQRMSSACLAGCPPPWPAPGLLLSAEDHYQSELWLPLAEIRPAFQRLYRAALAYPPILSSTPFADACGWAAIVSAMPPHICCSADPARLLEQLLADRILREKFLFWSFMPQRFYGDGSERYPEQSAFLDRWLAERHRGAGRLRCLDAACGAGAGTYGLALKLLECGWEKERFSIEGWTLDPLEAWSAAHAAFPHDPAQEAFFRRWTAPFFEQADGLSLIFRQADLLQPPEAESCFDLILCNGWIGGPILHETCQLRLAIENLTTLLAPGGLLLAADHFHGGWKKRTPVENLCELLGECGLQVSEAGEGIGGLKPD